MKCSIIVTGAAAAVSIPELAEALLERYENVELNLILTENARRIVGRSAVDSIKNSNLMLDSWDDFPKSDIPHRYIEQVSDIFFVFPCSLDYFASLAGFSCHTPSLLTLQCTSKQILVAPTLPPGGIDSRAYKGSSDELRNWNNLTILEPVPVYSISDQKMSAFGAGSYQRICTMLDSFFLCAYHSSREV